MAAEALIVEDAYQRGYADAIADMRKKKEQRRQREQAKKARRWYAVLGLCYMGAAYMSQHYERTVETAVLGATYVGNSYLANTF